MKNFKKISILTTAAIIVSACSIDSNLNNLKVPTSQTYQTTMENNISEKKKILNIVKNFATSVACSTSFDDDAVAKTTVNDVFLVGTSNLGDPKNESFNSDYLVFWSGDMGCSGGVVDNTSFMTALNKISDTRPFLVETGFGRDDIRHDQFFSDLDIYPNFVSEVDYKDGIFSIVSGHDNGDGENGWIGNNSPRYEYLYTVAGDAHEGWRVVDKKLLSEHKLN
jgi:hypothetical protein